MMLECLCLAAFADNYIWVIRRGRNVVVVDPGDAAPVEAFLREQNCHLNAILLTHLHDDHVGGVARLRAPYAVPVYGPSTGIAQVTLPVSDGDVVRIEAMGLAMAVLAVPGHTLDHLAYFTLPGEGQDCPMLFCGDTMFACGCGRLFEGRPEQMLASLDKLAALPGETRMYCAHEYTRSNIRFALACEPDNADLLAWQKQVDQLRAQDKPSLPTTLAHELRVNPFLRAERPAIQQRLAVQFGQAVDNRLSAFTLMREWKNRFA